MSYSSGREDGEMGWGDGMGSWDTDLVTLSETTAAQRENEVPTFTVVESKGQRPVLYKFGK